MRFVCMFVFCYMFLSDEVKTILLCVTVFCTAPCAADVENFYDPSKEKKNVATMWSF